MTPNQGPQKLGEQADQAQISSISVSSFMNTSPVVFTPATTIVMAIQSFSAERVSGAPVIDSAGRLLGMVSEFDLLLQAATQDLNSRINFKKDVIGLRPGDTLKEALVILYKHKIRRLPVVGTDGLLVGVVARIDILNRIVEAMSAGG